MSAIQQIYCTHCTHGSSALERRQGELAARMLGYSVRAGSLEGDALRQVYRQVERYVSYHLPHDTPGEQKLQLTAATAPRRLIFIPAAGLWQVIGHVCYRQRDTEGRPGSYFAHLLCREVGEAGQSWTLLDALRLWGAPGWVTGDSAEHGFVLPTLDHLDSLLGGVPARIDDQALLAFLRGDNRPFASGLPDRWLDLVPARRVEILKRMLGALLTTGTTRRQTLLVAMEPEVAALFFYGVGRLLPPGVIRAGVSMSTFEASADRLTTALAATTFWNPATAEFDDECLRGRGLALNTFGDFSGGPENGSAYAESAIRRLLEEGCEAVERRLRMIASAGPDRIEALERFTRTEHAMAAMFRSAGGADESWRTDAALTQFARLLAEERLASFDGAEAAFNNLCGGASHATILELAAANAPGGAPDRGIRFLLERLPEGRIAALVGADQIDDAWKIELLGKRIAATGRMPAGCEWLWDEDGGQASLAATRRQAIAVGVMSRLAAGAAVAVLGSLDASRRLAAVDRLMDACDHNPAQWAGFAEVVRRLDVTSLTAAWRKLGSRFFEVPDSVGETVTARLMEILNTLHEHSSEFAERLEFLEAGRRWLSDPDADRRLAAWLRCRDALIELAGMKETGGTWRQLTAARRFESAAERMTEAAIEAMPASLLEDDRQGSAKQERLRAIGRQLAGGEPFLPADQWQNAAIWKKISWRIEMGSWTSAPLHKMTGGTADRRQMWIAVAIAAAVVLGVLGVIGLATVGLGPNESSQMVVERGEARVPSATQTVKDEPKTTNVPEKGDGLPNGGLPTDPRSAQLPEDPAPEPFVAPPGPDASHEAGQAAAIVPEHPLASIPGSFAATMAPVHGLKQPVVALIALEVRGADGDSVPKWLREQFVLGAVVQEQSAVREPRYLELPDFQTRNQLDLYDGVDKLLVQFRFSRKPADSAAGLPVIRATSFSWAEVPILPAQRYDIRFVLSPEAVDELRRLASEVQ